MNTTHLRTIMLLGEERFQKLHRSFVAIFGLGGVGSYAAEAIVRAGIGRVRVVDCDVVRPSDLNRQLYSVLSGLGRPKAELAGEHLRTVHPDVIIECHQAFFHKDTENELVTPDLSFVIDAVDSIGPKVQLIECCLQKGIPIISVMGAAGKTDPAMIRLAKLEETVGCPLARMVKKKLRHHAVIANIPVVFSLEQTQVAFEIPEVQMLETEGVHLRGRMRCALPSISTIPGIFGLTAANYVIWQIAGKIGSR